MFAVQQFGVNWLWFWLYSWLSLLPFALFTMEGVWVLDFKLYVLDLLCFTCIEVLMSYAPSPHSQLRYYFFWWRGIKQKGNLVAYCLSIFTYFEYQVVGIIYEGFWLGILIVFTFFRLGDFRVLGVFLNWHYYTSYFFNTK